MKEFTISDLLINNLKIVKFELRQSAQRTS